MSTVCAPAASVNTVSSAHPGQPSKQAPTRLRALNRTLVQAALTCGEMPSDADLAQRLAVSERTVRHMRLQVLGLNRHELKRWRQSARPSTLPL